MFTMYMALHINNVAVEQTVRELAAVTGESMTDAIGAAVIERLDRVKSHHFQPGLPSVEEIMAMIRSYNLQPIDEGLTEDKILGYGPDGIPE